MLKRAYCLNAPIWKIVILTQNCHRPMQPNATSKFSLVCDYGQIFSFFYFGTAASTEKFQKSKKNISRSGGKSAFIWQIELKNTFQIKKRSKIGVGTKMLQRFSRKMIKRAYCLNAPIWKLVIVTQNCHRPMQSNATSKFSLVCDYRQSFSFFYFFDLSRATKMTKKSNFKLPYLPEKIFPSTKTSQKF